MLRNEIEKSLIKLNWRHSVKEGREEWFAETRLYYNLKIKKVSDENKVFVDRYYIYKVMPNSVDFLVNNANTENCDTLEKAMQAAWKSYVSTIECLFRV